MKKLKIAGTSSKKSELQTLHDSSSDLTKMIETLSTFPDSNHKKTALIELRKAALAVSKWRYAQQDVENELKSKVE